jgi:hypothetical protein
MKYSAEDRRRIMSEARANSARPRPKLDAEAPPAPPIKYRAVNNALDQPELLTPALKLAKPEPPRLDWVDWSDYIADAIATERKFTLRVVGEALGKQLRDLDDGFEDIKSRLDQLDTLLKLLRTNEERALDWSAARRVAAVN